MLLVCVVPTCTPSDSRIGSRQFLSIFKSARSPPAFGRKTFGPTFFAVRATFLLSAQLFFAVRLVLYFFVQHFDVPYSVWSKNVRPDFFAVRATFLLSVLCCITICSNFHMPNDHVLCQNSNFQFPNLTKFDVPDSVWSKNGYVQDGRMLIIYCC